MFQFLQIYVLQLPCSLTHLSTEQNILRSAFLFIFLSELNFTYTKTVALRNLI